MTCINFNVSSHQSPPKVKYKTANYLYCVIFHLIRAIQIKLKIDKNFTMIRVDALEKSLDYVQIK